MLLVKNFYYVCANFPSIRTLFSVKALPRRKVAEPKSNDFHEMLDLFCFQSLNIESRGTKEAETLHVVYSISQLPPLYLWKNSSKSNNFQGKRSSEEKSGQSKKHKLHEMPELSFFQWQNIELGGA